MADGTGLAPIKELRSVTLITPVLDEAVGFFVPPAEADADGASP